MNEQPTTERGEDDRVVLTIRIASTDAVFDELEERFASLDDGSRPEPMYEVVLQRETDLNRLLRSNTVELLRTIAREEPASIRETARLVDRDIKQVYDNLIDLEEMNLVRFHPDGRSKRPVVWYDEIEIELPISEDHPSSAPA